MKRKSQLKIIGFLIMINLVLIFGALLIEHSFNFLMLELGWPTWANILVLLGCFVVAVLGMGYAFWTMLQVLSFSGIEKSVFGERKAERFFELLKKAKRDKLSIPENLELQWYLKNSVLADDYVKLIRERNDVKMSLLDWLKAIIAMIFLGFILTSKNKNEHNTD